MGHSGGAQSPLSGELGEGWQPVRWRRSPGVLWRTVLDDAVLLAAEGEGEPFALSGGAELWRLLGEARTTEELAAALLPEPGPDRGRFDEFAPDALGALLSGLAAEGVVEQVQT